MNPLNHVAIIMDGNGRWGIKHKNSRNAGHKAGLIAVEKVIKETNGLGLHYNIQIHLPATKDIEVYNAIFKSLKEHLIE